MSVFNFAELENIFPVPAHAKDLLSKPEKQIILNISVWLDNKTLLSCEGYIVYHNTARGPAKGGLRISPGVTLEETIDLAERMTLKTALTGIPFGGGKSGICVKDNVLSPYDKTNLVKEYVHLIRNELTSGIYIPAPDMNTGPKEMAVIYGELHIPECVTGKPIGIGGLPGRKEATGYGVAVSVAYSYNKYFKKDLNGVAVAVQGFGNVGSWTAHFLKEKGARIIGISDISGGVYNKKGLDMDKLCEHMKEKDSKLCNFSGGDKITNEELIGLDVEIFVPAALENVITKDTAPSIKAKLIVEGANGPTTPEADSILEDRGIIVVPDFLANSGGVIGSYMEWKSSKSGSITPVSEVYRTISDIITGTFEKIFSLGSAKKVSNRKAAMALAVQELIETMKDRGWI
ncbi:MAG: hypothetical protein AUJ85_02350 [Elusimicrobia bacterium CG1_02_37_114]|nr:MAG: hypothetical protein AUJ85_02350 [Elusimicrobia bacterium CG1_02_37_114]PIV52718.1 MAG: hypothetical protein COS17_07680 [Elusimicrobia bacterium CG02_land_8_20_14_3_00_37_13]PIZ13249.1 MAG: hypothetical protein COY53_05780 [Elusimicrobia bacterium CG_4_10_14_0_8_um_filter_37_32]